MKIAIYQFAPLRGNVAGNIGKIEAVLRQYSDIDLWVLPELSTTGYLFENRTELLPQAEQFPGGRTGQWLSKITDQLKTSIVIGVAEKYNAHLFNSAVVFSNGEQIGRYRKIHLFSDEKVLFSAGDEPPPVVEIAGAKVGIMICFDWIYPEISRTLALKGAQLIAHPANLVLPYCPDAMITRSIENRVFTATANRIGSEQLPGGQEMNFIGNSQITDIQGNRLGRLSGSEEAVLVVEIDTEQANNKQITNRNDLFGDRKPHLYFKN